MISRDYTKEVGLKPGTVRVPLPLALVALAVIGAGLWVGAMKLHASAPPRVKEEAPTSHAATKSKAAPVPARSVTQR